MPQKIYYSVNKSLRIGADEIQRETRFTDGSINQESAVIPFYENIYRTSNAKEQKVIEGTTDFKMGRVKIIGDEQLDNLVAAKAENLGLPQDLNKEESGLPEEKDLNIINDGETVTGGGSDITINT